MRKRTVALHKHNFHIWPHFLAIHFPNLLLDLELIGNDYDFRLAGRFNNIYILNIAHLFTSKELYLRTKLKLLSCGYLNKE